jgi:hypothetical protein
MEVVSCCTGRAWRARLIVNSDNVRKIVDGYRREAGVEASWTLSHGAWLLEGSRAYASDEDPLVEVRVLESSHVLVEATLGGKRLSLSNLDAGHSPTDPLWECGDHLRLARTEETIELALRWLLLWGRMGCEEPDSVAFWEAMTTATPFVVDAPTRWFAASAPFPYKGQMNGAFVAYCGQVSLTRAGEGFGRLAEDWTDGDLAAGVYPNPRRDYALVAVARRRGDPLEVRGAASLL